MKDSLFCGLAVGFVIGALVIINSKEAKAIMEKGKKAVEQKVKELATK